MYNFYILSSYPTKHPSSTKAMLLTMMLLFSEAMSQCSRDPVTTERKLFYHNGPEPVDIRLLTSDLVESR